MSRKKRRRSKPRYAAYASALFAAAVLALFWLTREPPISWVTDFERGVAAARTQSRPAIAVFDATWCSWCQLYHRGTLADRGVVSAITRDYVPILIDFDARPDLAARYQVRGLPYTLLLSPHGEFASGFVGILRPADMLATLTAARSGQSPDGAGTLPAMTITPRAATRAEYQRIRSAFLDHLEQLYDPDVGTLLGKLASGATLKRPSPRTWLYLTEHELWKERRLRAARAERTRLFDPIDGGFFNFLDPSVATGDYLESSKLLESNAWLTLWFANEKDEAARGGWHYLRNTLWDHRFGGFFQAQNADDHYYSLSAEQRRQRTIPPLDRIKRADTNAQAAWVLAALARLWNEREPAALAAQTLNFVLIRMWRDGHLFHALRGQALNTPDQPLDWFWLLAAAAELPHDGLDPVARRNLETASRQAAEWLQIRKSRTDAAAIPAELAGLIAWVGGRRDRYPALPVETRELGLRALRLDGETAPDDVTLALQAWETLLTQRPRRPTD